jgi:hypothetical protein
MNRETAEKILDATSRIDGIIGELDLISWSIGDEAERKNLQGGIAACIAVVYEKITREVALVFPDLHPDFPAGDWPGGSDRY